MAVLPIPVVVLAERVIARLPMVCFVRRPQILAVLMHHALLLMVVLSILEVVLAERLIVLYQMDCIVILF